MNKAANIVIDLKVKVYAGRCTSCNNVVALTLTNNKDRTADVIAGWIRDGLRIEVMNAEDARQAFSVCNCKRGKDEQSV